MTLGTLEIVLLIRESHSLKSRRRVVKSLVDRIRSRFNVSVADIEASLGEANPLLEVRRLGSGGHVGFPPWLDLGEDAPGGLERQVLRWLERRLR